MKPLRIHLTAPIFSQTGSASPKFGVAVKIEEMSNNDLWREWTDSLEGAAADPQDKFLRRREEQCMNEIVRRMQAATHDREAQRV